MGSHLNELLERGRVVLFFDGLNETPAAERHLKATQIKELLSRHPNISSIISCRALDYTEALDLDLNTLTIRPLDAPRVLDFVTAYLTAAIHARTGTTARARSCPGRSILLETRRRR